ncbi:MAG TPA: MauE/DoxX family redox-associated membrane protein [Polyangiaceae bacterium LLY-WYZ-15_(1-7)]|nr:MauE/DoxX family redox-associated membrane protein [Polyangiaceae bacterium LLY-WYZ-15_(1-7)]HJL13203.1 MauE/DoxX family redox-associated membrane protein [Polyangiaceae bacterium LLY-WYZ-15_(1-7)]HJL22474.1 MauE/DoxX family redox-associated membrane protein [Polyangiaceae bacterium LLY-WYZ-15_(1-7)]HJL32319.1 MauE/DoxX family redox-associated membrane protein [Polyangiaceae bacterium LLY-WYZ-15_(1-7)]HJL34763.1 MauE/DoxX family redox-associated membrane protein [Polyangiaceae bacterium LLY-
MPLSRPSAPPPPSFRERWQGDLGLWVSRVGAWIVAAVFLWAAVPKLMDPARFAVDIANYRLVPEAWVGWAALAVPPLELVAALALLTGFARRGAALVAAGMLAFFAVAIGQAVVRGIDIDCGCFGSAAEARATWWSVARNVGLIACCVLALAWRKPPDPRAVDEGSSSSPS